MTVEKGRNQERKGNIKKKLNYMLNCKVNGNFKNHFPKPFANKHNKEVNLEEVSEDALILCIESSI